MRPIAKWQSRTGKQSAGVESEGRRKPQVICRNIKEQEKWRQTALEKSKRIKRKDCNHEKMEHCHHRQRI